MSAEKPEGTPIDIEKMRSIGVISKRTKDRVEEGKTHPDSGAAYKATTDELGNTVTEHSTSDDRVDVTIRPETVHGFATAHRP